MSQDKPPEAPTDMYYQGPAHIESPKDAGAEFGKVDRALEMQVIDWLQWGEFEERLDKPSMPALALELIAKRKTAFEKLERELAEAKEIMNDQLVQQRQTSDLLTQERARADGLAEALEHIAEIDYLINPDGPETVLQQDCREALKKWRKRD